MNNTINEVLEKLHQRRGLPRLEIEGCNYPINKDFIERYKKSKASMPEHHEGFSVVHFDAERGSNWKEWLKHDGFGGQVGSVNIPSEYLEYLDAPKGDRCVYAMKDKFDRRDYYYTEIYREYILFKKSDLVRVIKIALKTNNKVAEEIIIGKEIVDNVIWDDSIPKGPGLKVMDATICLRIDLNEEPSYKISLVKP